jgi:acetoin utilization deacetylase AcuC-like enzyme
VVLTVFGPSGGMGPGHPLHQAEGHPERPARINAAMAGVADVARLLGSDLEIVPAVPADAASLARVHSADYLRRVEEFCRSGGGHLDLDTFSRPDSWQAALLSAGAGLEAVARLWRDDDSQAAGAGPAFVATRPPGHHALADHSMGFCLLNNVAVSAAALVAAGERVLIVDWDVHHGNGTQAMFWDEPSVLYVSTHQSPWYPGTGAADEVGGPGARGLTVNVPLPAGATGDVVRRALDEVAAPVVEDFRPTWVLVSAGFDAHRADPLAELALSSGDFADLAATVAAYAPRPERLVLFLEGGYDLEALRSSVAATLGALVGVGAGSGGIEVEARTSGGPGTESVTRAATARQRALGDDT